MDLKILSALQDLAGLIAGGLIGVAFGMLQNGAWRRNTRLESAGQFNSAWAVMPGSFRRIAFLILALALIQLVCPLLFTNGTEWWVSGGVVGGYGSMLWRHLRKRLFAKPSNP